MAVFTPLTTEQTQDFLLHYNLGELVSLQGITAGIENTNFFLNTTKGEFVLTIFEVLTFEQLPFYIQLMYHLAQKGIKVPMPQVRKDGELIGHLMGKPASIVTRLSGGYEATPSKTHCMLAADIQAHIHLATQDYPLYQENLRGLPWWQANYPKIAPFLSDELNSFYQKALNEQITLQESSLWKSLPSSACHCDLFRDNVLFDGTYQSPAMGGVIDFYFAGVDKWIFDVAVAVNDWCIHRDTGEFIRPHVKAWLDAYHKVRPFTKEEREVWPQALRAAALRFWTSRLYDFYLPRAAETLKPHDPTHFERVLQQRFTGYIPTLP
ncbi:homoserine kinase [Pelistega sp. NLN82]|uniref:Homoserine kinase n=1 Tax=Pelistega ratti TaxID=2652177 RepID=A0A6L9Y7P2_9BURK|nr:homoserine kinase [Pelistega ratti]NEN76530.1 homoserine kinase [Pelistega ratti]